MSADPLRRILLVEDDLDIQAVIQLSLEMNGGFTVATCARASQALDLARSFGPDLILLDVMMPDLNGPALLGAMRQDPDLAGIPAVFLTAKSLDEDPWLERLPGVLARISKPFDPQELVPALLRIWAGRVRDPGSPRP